MAVLKKKKPRDLENQNIAQLQFRPSRRSQKKNKHWCSFLSVTIDKHNLKFHKENLIQNKEKF